MIEKVVNRSYMRLLLWTFLIVVFAIGMPLSPFVKLCPTVDSAIFLTCAKWMQEGLVMYRDMFDHKGPLIYLFDALGLQGGLTGVWCLCILWVLVTTHLVYEMCHLFTDSISAFVASLVFILMMMITGADNTVELVAMPFVAWGMLVMLKPMVVHRDVSVTSVFIASFCLAIMFLLKPNIGAGIAFLAIIILIKLICDFSIRRFLNYLWAFLAGFALVFLPMYIVLMNYEAWDDYVSTFWKFNMEYSSNLSWGTKLINFGQLFFCYIPSLISWVFVIFVLIKDRNNPQKRTNLFLLSMLLFTGLVSTGVSGFRFGHYLLPVFPIFAIFIAKAFQAAKGKQAYGIYSILILWALYFGYKQYSGYKYAAGSNIQSIFSAVDYVKESTSANDIICLYGVDASVYLLSDRKTVTKYIYQNPIFGVRPSMEKEFYSDIQRGKPFLLLLGKNNQLPISIMRNYRCIKIINDQVMIYQLNSGR